ncbi:MAG TPA: SDR family NAD(P)-dependent oxidoreductase, partial [Nocardioidaceae bacterium]|nr:SDR family NAD(P)-dependent oxidoreductase [Nocardioidaceae bacterium]
MGLLDDRVVVVSGTGPGLGAAIALQSARAGAAVVLAARSEERLEKVAAAVREAGGDALVVPTDITDDASAQAVLDRTLAEHGKVDALVNNAFVMPPIEPVGEADFDAIRSGLETNVLGSLRMSKVFVPALEQTQGAIVMINSAVLRHSSPEYGAYKMGKAALLAMAQTLASEVGPRGVRVNSVAPGYIYADSLKWYFDYLAGERGVTHQQVYDETAVTCDLRRL